VTRTIGWVAGGLAWALTVQVQDAPRAAEETARGALADAALSAAASATEARLDEDLDAWARSVIERALSNAPEDGTLPRVPAEEQATRVAEALSGTRTDGLPSARTEVIVFMSLSVPEASWRQWSRVAARIGVPMVLRGVGPGGIVETAGEIRNRIQAFGGEETQPGEGPAGAALDPRLFRLFRVAHVPAVAVVPGGVPPCETRGCSSDPAPPHDLITGNIGLEAALEAISREDGHGRASARRHLAALRGEVN